MTTALRGRPGGGAAPVADPWHALWAMMVGFFMILVDATIVSVANPSIMVGLGAGYDAVIWVTSAYLLGFAVPLLLAGRLGDRYGPKNLYLVGLLVFTAASLWCGLSGTIGMLVAARVVQGIGAALLTPQTLSTITRIFPAQRRGVAMSVWGATAGVATLVGPLAGGVLVDGLGWQWIFFVNVPIGIVGLGLAFWFVPDLPTEKHGFDIIGVLLSGIGMFMVVFALQEGQAHDWAPWIWGTLAGGVGFMAAFVFWQQANRNEPLVPLGIFRDRDFSLSTLGVATIGFTVTAMILPLMFYAQEVCGLSPTRSALLTAPMAIASGVLAPWVGKIVDRYHPRPIIGFGFSMLAIAVTWLSVEMTPTTPIWRIVLPLTATGVGMAFIWSPLAATATRNLASDVAGAGSGVYNATRQVGSVLGSAGMAAFMTTRISAEMPTAGEGPAGEGSVTQLPAFLHEPFAAAMSQSLLLPAFVALFGVVAAMFLLGFGSPADPERQRVTAADDRDRHDDDYVDDDYVDDDDYVEFTVTHHEPRATAPSEPVAAAQAGDEGDTEPIGARRERPTPPADDDHPGTKPESPVEMTAPVALPSEQVNAQAQRHEPVRNLLDFLGNVPPPSPSVEPIGFAHNGFHTDDEERFQPLRRFKSIDESHSHDEPQPPKPDVLSPDYPLDFGSHARYESPDEIDREPRHELTDDESPPNGRHFRAESDDAASRGRHYRPGE
jgi:EmrB/QacA subfamily drug resistance transporter